MSDSITNLEIEDVLSSIRRLVSADESENADAVPDSSGHFVLTPALRVPDDHQPDQSMADTQPGPEISNGAAPAKLEPDLDSDGETDAADQSGSDAEATTSSGKDDAGNDDAQTDAHEPVTVPSPAASEPAAVTLESRIAELEQAVGQTREEWEPDGSETDDAQVPKIHIYQAQHEPEPEPEPEDETDPEDEASVFEKNAVFFRAAAPRSDAYGFAVADRDPADGDATGQEDETTDAGAEPDEEDEFLDEFALRTMVSEIVREELRGSTGERITRNMRRMVRREIQRAIALKDVDPQD